MWPWQSYSTIKRFFLDCSWGIIHLLICVAFYNAFTRKIRVVEGLVAAAGGIVAYIEAEGLCVGAWVGVLTGPF